MNLPTQTFTLEQYKVIEADNNCLAFDGIVDGVHRTFKRPNYNMHF